MTGSDWTSLGLGALGGDLFAGRWFAVVAPRVALVVDDVEDVVIGEGACKWRHRAHVVDASDLLAVKSVQHDTDMRHDVVSIDGAVSLERWEDAGDALTGGLMTGRAVGGEQCETLRGVVAVARGRCRCPRRGGARGRGDGRRCRGV